MIRKSDPDGWYDPDKPAPVPEGIETTDYAPTKDVLIAVMQCAYAWEGTARIIGNIRAQDISRACREVLAEIARLNAINADLLKVNLSHAEALARIAELDAERDRLLIAEEDAKLFILLHALAIEQGYMPDPGESAYDLLQRAIMTNSPTAIRARPTP